MEEDFFSTIPHCLYFPTIRADLLQEKFTFIEKVTSHDSELNCRNSHPPDVSTHKGSWTDAHGGLAGVDATVADDRIHYTIITTNVKINMELQFSDAFLTSLK